MACVRDTYTMGPAERNISEHLEWNLGNRKKKKNYQNKYEINFKKIVVNYCCFN